MSILVEILLSPSLIVEVTLANTVQGGSGATTYDELTDTPSSKTALNYVRVNAAGTEHEYTDAPLESSDNVSELTNDVGYIADITGESVTDLTDVTDSGSGQIITDGERTDLGTALQPGDNIVNPGNLEAFSGSKTLNALLYSLFEMPVTGDTTIGLSNLANWQTIIIVLVNDASGGHTITLGATFGDKTDNSVDISGDANVTNIITVVRNSTKILYTIEIQTP